MFMFVMSSLGNNCGENNIGLCHEEKDEVAG